MLKFSNPLPIPDTPNVPQAKFADVFETPTKALFKALFKCFNLFVDFLKNSVEIFNGSVFFEGNRMCGAVRMGVTRGRRVQPGVVEVLIEVNMRIRNPKVQIDLGLRGRRRGNGAKLLLGEFKVVYKGVLCRSRSVRCSWFLGSLAVDSACASQLD